MNEVEKLEGFVALIDVLGFREMVGKDDGLDQVRSYIDTVISILGDGNQSSSLQFVLFSDNLVINTTNNSDSSLKSIIRACSVLSHELCKKRIAVRGAIAHGSFMRSPTTKQGVILAGRPIVEANHYQHLQNWVGTILAPSVVSRYDDLNKRCLMRKPETGEDEHIWADTYSFAMRLRRYQQIPFHLSSPTDNGNFDGYVVVPLPPGVRTKLMYSNGLVEFGQQLGIMKLTAPDPLSQEKYSKTLNWVGELAKGWG